MHEWMSFKEYSMPWCAFWRILYKKPKWKIKMLLKNGKCLENWKLKARFTTLMNGEQGDQKGE